MEYALFSYMTENIWISAVEHSVTEQRSVKIKMFAVVYAMAVVEGRLKEIMQPFGLCETLF